LTYLLSLFANNVLPVLLAAGAGFLVSRYTQISPSSISHLVFKVFVPCLLFRLLTTTQLSGEAVFRMVGFTIASTLAVGLLAGIIVLILKKDKRTISAVLLVVMFNNAGNYGLSLNKFAFGDTALAYASIYFATSIIMINTLGVVLASLGSADLKKALLELFKTPVIYAVLLALGFSYTGWELPTPLQRTVFVLADASIPLMLVLMGVQLQHAKWTGQVRAIGFSAVMRLVVAPLIALAFAGFFSLEGSARQAGILESAMPTAVMMTILATEYRVVPTFVTMAVVVSTILSPLTITPILAMLGA